jgi:hypothetical protein
MFELIFGVILVIACPIILVKTYMNWRKHNAGYRESKEASPDTNYYDVVSLQGFMLGGIGFFIGLYFILNYFNLN